MSHMIIIEATPGGGWTLDYIVGERPIIEAMPIATYRHTSYARTPGEMRAAIEGMVREAEAEANAPTRPGWAEDQY